MILEIESNPPFCIVRLMLRCLASQDVMLVLLGHDQAWLCFCIHVFHFLLICLLDFISTKVMLQGMPSPQQTRRLSFFSPAYS